VNRKPVERREAMKLEPSLFVIESLKYKDEGEERFEGRILRQILKLIDKRVEYIYIRTRKELGFALKEFRRSNLRYLHLSCHGDRESISLTLEDPLSFKEFGTLARPYLDYRRLFISACDAATKGLADEILINSSCFSLVGPCDDIKFADAALIWASFYRLAFRINRDGMNRKAIREALGKTCNLFSVPFKYFRRYEGRNAYEDVTLQPHVQS
jgi:hypothetical protein